LTDIELHGMGISFGCIMRFVLLKSAYVLLEIQFHSSDAL